MLSVCMGSLSLDTEIEGEQRGEVLYFIISVNLTCVDCTSPQEPAPFHMFDKMLKYLTAGLISAFYVTFRYQHFYKPSKNESSVEAG